MYKLSTIPQCNQKSDHYCSSKQVGTRLSLQNTYNVGYSLHLHNSNIHGMLSGLPTKVWMENNEINILPYSAHSSNPISSPMACAFRENKGETYSTRWTLETKSFSPGLETAQALGRSISKGNCFWLGKEILEMYLVVRG